MIVEPLAILAVGHVAMLAGGEPFANRIDIDRGQARQPVDPLIHIGERMVDLAHRIGQHAG